MAESLTLTVTGRSSILDVQYFPPIELSPYKSYALGLIQLLTYNSIPNVDESNNKLHFYDFTIAVPTGSYEIADIGDYIQKEAAKHDVDISIKANNNTLECEIVCSEDINFTLKDSIGQLLGISRFVFMSDSHIFSELPVSIIKVNAIRVECSITTGSYVNGSKVHTIHEFFPTVPPGYKIVEAPSNVIYLPVTVKTIDHIQLRIVDQSGSLVNFRGEEITVRLHIKSMQ